MSAAAAKRTVLAAASVLALVVVSVAGPAGGASSGKRDRVAPTPPANPHVTAATPSRVSLSWDPAQDDVGVAGYYVYGDYGRATVAGTSYVVTSLGCGESSAVSVSAFDTSGNRSSKVSTTIATAACPDVQPPTAPSGFVQSATTQTGVVLGWSPSTDDVGVVGYGVYSATSRVGETSELGTTLSGLTCGSTYSYGVDAVDASGNRSPISTTFVQTASCADGRSPSQPAGFAVALRTLDSLSLVWTPSTDDVGVAGYRVTVNGTPATTVSQPSATVGGLTCGTSYTIGVDAFDAAGNRSPASTLFAATDACPPQPQTSDTTPPTKPVGLAVSNVSQSGLTLTWSASTDNVAVTGYDVSRDGVKVATVGSTSSSQSGLTCGTAYTLSVIARDAAGNSSQAAQVVESTSACSSPPPPADTTPPSQPLNLAISSATASSVTVGWVASSDNVGVAGYRTYVNGSAGSTTTQTAATFSNLSCGTAYTLEVDAFDAAGNRSTRASVVGSTSACPDAQPPSTPTNLVSTSRTVTSIALSWTASSDNIGITGYGLYRGTTLVGTSSTTSGIFSGLACNTSYTLAVDAYDAAGNRSQKVTTMVSTTACPDTTPPSAPTQLAASNVTQSDLSLSWTQSNDNVGVTGYDVYRNGTKMTTVTTTSASQSGLACGTSYTFAVVARDAAGNQSSQATLTAQTAACAAPPPPSSPPVTAHFISDWSTGMIAYKPWATIFQPGTPSTVDVGYYGSPPVASAPSGRVAVVPNPYGPGNVLRCEIRNSDPSTGSNNFQKAEVGSVETVTWDGQWSDGQEIWISMELYLPDAFGLASGSFTNVMDLHPSSSSGVPGLGLGGYKTDNIQLYAGVPGSLQRRDFIALTPANRNRKLNVLIGAKIGTSGWVEAWLDGVNVVPRFSAVTAEASESGPYFKQGLYKETAASFPNGGSTIYFGHTYIGKTKASVAA